MLYERGKDMPLGEHLAENWLDRRWSLSRQSQVSEAERVRRVRVGMSERILEVVAGYDR